MNVIAGISATQHYMKKLCAEQIGSVQMHSLLTLLKTSRE